MLRLTKVDCPTAEPGAFTVEASPLMHALPSSTTATSLWTIRLGGGSQPVFAGLALVACAWHNSSLSDAPAQRWRSVLRSSSLRLPCALLLEQAVIVDGSGLARSLSLVDCVVEFTSDEPPYPALSAAELTFSEIQLENVRTVHAALLAVSLSDCTIDTLSMLGTNQVSLQLHSTAVRSPIEMASVHLSGFAGPLLCFDGSVSATIDVLDLSIVDSHFAGFSGSSLFRFSADIALALTLDGIQVTSHDYSALFDLTLTDGRSTVSVSQSVFDANQGSAFRMTVDSEVAMSMHACNVSRTEGASVLDLRTLDDLSKVDLTLTDSLFAHNAFAHGNGAVISADLKSMALRISGSRFSDNSAHSGSVLSLAGMDSLSIDQCLFERNAAEDRGVIHMVSAKMDLQWTKSEFRHNRADKGGVLSIDVLQDSLFRIEECTFAGNTAADSGGALYLDNIKQTDGLNLSHCLFAENSAGQSGGAVFISDASDGRATTDEVWLDLEDVRFRDNIAEQGSGGALSVRTVPFLLLTHAEFDGNSAGFAPVTADVDFAGQVFVARYCHFGEGLLAQRLEFEETIVAIEHSSLANLQTVDCAVNMTGVWSSADGSVNSVKPPWLELQTVSDLTVTLDLMDATTEDNVTHSVDISADSTIELALWNGDYGTVRFLSEAGAAHSMPASLTVSSEQSSVYPSQNFTVTVSAQDWFAQPQPITEEQCRWDASLCRQFRFKMELRCADESRTLLESTDQELTLDSHTGMRTVVVDDLRSLCHDYPILVSAVRVDSYWPISDALSHWLTLETEDCPATKNLYRQWMDEDRTQYACKENAAISTQTYDPTQSADFTALWIALYLILVCIAMLTGYSFIRDRNSAVPACGPLAQFGHSPAKVQYVWMFTAQVLDFISDVLLAGTLWNVWFAVRKKENQKVDSDAWFYLALSATVFTVLPYALNLFMAVTLSRTLHKYCPFNDAAMKFANDKKVVIIFCVFWSGGLIPTLQLLSSRLLHLSLFDMGLATHELSQLTGLKFYLTTLTENVPQLCVQIATLVFEAKTGNNDPFNGIIALSLLSSVISVLSAAAVYAFQKCEDESTKLVIPFKLSVKFEMETPVTSLKMFVFYKKTRLVPQCLAGAFELDEGSSVDIGSFFCIDSTVRIFGYFLLGATDQSRLEALALCTGDLSESHPAVAKSLKRLCMKKAKQEQVQNLESSLLICDDSVRMNRILSISTDTSLAQDLPVSSEEGDIQQMTQNGGGNQAAIRLTAVSSADFFEP